MNKNELENLILVKNIPYSEIGKLYGVTGNTIKKKAKLLEIKLPKRRNVNSTENFSHKGFKKNSLVNDIDDEIFKNIIKNNTTWVKIGELLGYKNKISSNVKNSIQHRCLKLNIELLIISDKNDLLDKTKGEIFAKRANWQSARSAIQKSARILFFAEIKEPKCVICGYAKHIDVAHIKSVSSFDENSTVRKINSLSNLVGLCPNHHWEYDNGLLIL